MGGQNRIVVDYGGFEGLVLLAAYDNNTGQEVDRIELEKLEGFDVVKRYNSITDYKSLKSMVKDNQEGFVIRFKNGFRMKIKGDEYCRLHKILTNVSNRDIWEYLKDGKPPDDILDKVPDEFYNWVRETIKDFENKFEEILEHVITNYWEIENKLIEEQISLGNDMVFDEREYAKKYAEHAKKMKHTHLLFSYRREPLNPIRTKKGIWDMLYPEYQKPFKKDNDE